ncbi:uncharacterized protein [Gossypium hirsutum]|uniref:Gag-pro-like protein n=1 Tax=Gossypium hirsutum TaxID=3635 RepID=A0ABM2YL41_GOSHI|nr:uncharacterized protein LOC121204592 [Gossypium hirsutum]
MIENAVRGGKIEREVAKRSAPRRKDNEVNSLNSRAITVGQPKAAMVEQQNTQRQESGIRQNSKRIQFTPIPVTYRELYQSLHDAHAIAPFHLKPLQPPYPRWYDANAKCEYHAGILGHSIENCTGFKKAVERLIKMGVVKLDSTPNTENLLPDHEFKVMVQGFIVNKELQVSEGSSYERQICVLENERQRTNQPRIIISLPGNNEEGSQTRPKIVIHKPNPFPYKDDKRVPWSYDCNITIPEGESIASASRGTQNEGSHTRSGKCYDGGHIIVEPAKTKDVEAEREKETEVLINEPVKEEEAKEFLKFLKHSEYSVVEQLRKQPTRISVLALLLNPEVHRDALLKVLNETYVTHDISVNKLDRLPIDSSHMKTSHNVVRAFDGTERKVMGRIDIPLEIGPNTYEVDFLDIIAAVTSKAPYVEANEEAIECSFCYLEVINATFILEGSEVPVPKMSGATRMALRMMMGKGALPRKGLGRQLQLGVQIPKLIEKKDRFGLGFKPDHKHKRQEIEKRQARRNARLNGREMEWEPMTFPPISKSFKSGGLLIKERHQVNAVHNEGSEQGSLEEAKFFIGVNQAKLKEDMKELTLIETTDSKIDYKDKEKLEENMKEPALAAIMKSKIAYKED